MILRKVFRYRMEPTTLQQHALARMAGARRFVWNWALAQCREHYREHLKMLPSAKLSKRLTDLKRKPQTAWLNDVDSQAMQQALADLWAAYRNFFAKRAGSPRLKSRKTDRARFRIPQRVTVAGGSVYVPKIGQVRIRQSRAVEGKTKSATFTRDATDFWHISLVTEFTAPDTVLPSAAPSSVVGVDLGVRAFAVLSNGERITSPGFVRRAERNLRRAARALSRREKGSKRRLRARNAVARIHAKIAHRRSDFIHKVTTDLVRRYEGIAIEDLNTKGLAKTKLAKSVLDAAFGEFRRQLEYKAVWNGRRLVVIDRWYPSSKTCSGCGAVKASLTLAERSWICDCGASHDRDFNAALNIRSEGLKLLSLAAGHAERLNARGPKCKTPTGAVGA